MPADVIENPKFPGDKGVWLFIYADMLAFALLFALFTFSRLSHVELFKVSQDTLNKSLGALNTLVLLASGWFMAEAVAAVRKCDRRAVVRYLQLALLIGVGFAFSKSYEYHEKLAAGINLLTNKFYMYYFVLTGIHFLHYLIGMVTIFVFMRMAHSHDMDPGFLVAMESVGCYWHMVDILWLVLFPMLYLAQ